ncbi:hypothetical protein SKAU_G00085340 [Synaphobranchus kaupii]|uniref:Tower domain-containing protein n=1 Tax=Synaphobranchus kaupii TaxID=118154 RepID=A0A9Q1J5X2_SYNKA|nr:hypothetical protein SKAU_G00085340 [Synaphobranchus kaupii]
MFEVFKHNIVQELGPLCPNWFEELTASAARDEASAPDPETSWGDCVQEDSLRTPARKAAVDSQIFSTPKIFKSHTARSPELLTTDEELFSPDREAAGGSKTIPWVDTSLCFFGSAKNGQTVDKLCNTRLPMDDSELLHMPKSLVAVSAKSISESLCAQLDPDVSWTSSLNTPPVMAPTVILTKEEDKAHPVSPSGDKRVILVRELFPSMSKVFQMAEISSEKPGLFGQPSEANSQFGCLKKASDCQELPSVDEKEVLWKQTLPDAILDGEVRSTVASVLDGAEDVLSIFFSNSSSALRRVKAKERIRRRQTSSAKEAELTPAPALENGSPEGPAKLSGQAEHVTDTFAFHKGNSPETKDCGITQWTPLTLPDISDTGAGTVFCAVPSSEEVAERQADAAQLERPAKGDESNSSDITVPGGALAYCDSVLPTNVANTQGKNVRPFHSAFPQQRPEASKRMRSRDSQPTVLPLNPPLPESKPSWDPGKCTMPESGPGNNVCSTEMQSGVLVLRPGESPVPGSSLEGCPAVASTRKPPRKFVYSLQSACLPGQEKHNRTAHSHTVSTPIVQLSGEMLNGKPSGHTVMSRVKTLQHSDDVTKDKSECEKLCEQAGNVRMEVVPTASNEAESRLHYMPPPCTTSAEDYNQEGNPGRAPSSSTDALGRDTDTNFSATACLNVIGLKQPSQPSPPKLTEKPGSADDHRNHDVVNCPSHSTAALTESIQATEMSGLPSASDTTRITCESQRRDSGYHTTWSDATQLHGSSDTVSGSRNAAECHAPMGFKMASNRTISLPQEAIQRAKALLDDAAQDSLIKASISKGKGPPMSTESTEWTRKSNYNGVKSSLVCKAAASRHGTSLSKVSSPHNSRSSLQGSSPNPGFVGFKTASNSMIHLSSANLLKAKQLFKDIEDEKLSEGSSRTSCTDFNAVGEVKAENGMSKSTVGLMAGPILTLPSSEQKGPEANGCLTASQRADVTELCSLLEANSQFEFTQFKQAKFTSTGSDDDKTASGVSTVDEKTVSVSEIDLQSTNPVPVKSDRIEHSVVPSSYKCIPQGPITQGQAADRQIAQEKGKAPICRSVSAPARERSAPGKAAVETVVCGTTLSDAGGTTQRSSSLNLRSLGLGNCTDTQQRYMEQEAMACTRALLEDEDLAEQGLQEAPGKRSLQQNAPTQSSAVKEAERSQVRGKRLKSEASTDQPPLKRRLLADFEETSDSDKLAPVKSSPNVTLRDRRIFRYGVPLQPNVTRPPSDKKGILDQRHRITEPQIVVPGSFLQDGKPANPQGVVFVPPFRKCPKPEIQGTNLPQESRRPPSLFVPPFRKTQPNTPLGQGPGQSSSSLSEAPPAVFVPPFKKTAGSASQAGSEEKMPVQESGTHRAVPQNTCDRAVSRQGPVTPNVPAGREAEREGPTLALPSPGDHEASSSDAQTLQNLQLARDLQDMRIRKKRRQRIRPQPGSLLLAKTAGVTRVPLRSAVGGKCPALHSQKELYACGVPRGASQVSSDSAESFRFRCWDFLRGDALTAGGGVQLADGGWLVPSDDGTAGKEQFYRALCDTPGVDPKLISEGWLYNHYRWVVWKRASMERAFPSVMGGHCLTPEQVLLQLKYRYDVEVDQSRRSALRKIMERDDTPAKTMMLCVCGVASTGSAPAGPVQPESKTSPGSGVKAGGSPRGVIWVTDGWYTIKALLDAPLTAMLLKGRLAVGGKVVTHGAELVGSQDACPPLEAPESLMLKISANSTRPARWDAKLGFHCDPRPFRLPLSSLYSNGGLVGSVDIVVLRSYPTQWMEKKPGGAFVFRNKRPEEREARRHSDSRHKAMEVLFAKIQAQFEKEQETKPTVKSRRRRLTCQEIEALQDGEELHEAVETDPVYMESCLNEQQLAVLSNYRQSLGQGKQDRLQERFRQALAEAQESEGSCSNRDVTPVWKLSVCDFVDRQSSNVYVLSIWRPPAELRSLLREGCRYRVYQLATSQGKKQAGRAAVQLTATKKTQFQHIQASVESLRELFQPRVSLSFRMLQGPSFHPVCGEVDTVGYVISIADRHGPSPVLYLADEHQDFVSVRINGNLAQLALEEVVKPQALLALSNLQLRHQSPSPIPGLYAGELALFSTNPKEPHLQEACARLRNIAQGNEHFFHMAEEKLSNFISPNVQSSLLSPRQVGPSPKMVNGQIPQQSVRTPGLFTPVSKRPPLTASTSEDRDPKSIKRKRGLDFLSRIPSPPPLSPLWGNASPSEAEWVNDEELAMINTQALLGRQEETGVSR